MLPAGLCLTDVTFFVSNVAPLIRQRVDGSQRGLLHFDTVIYANVITATNLVNFGSVTPEILWPICVSMRNTYIVRSYGLNSHEAYTEWHVLTGSHSILPATHTTILTFLRKHSQDDTT